MKSNERSLFCLLCPCRLGAIALLAASLVLAAAQSESAAPVTQSESTTAPAAQSPAVDTQAAPATAQSTPATTEAAPAAQSALAAKLGSGLLSDETLRQALVGKTLYLRGDYMDNSLEFDEHGQLAGSSPKGSYALCLVQITKVRMAKKRVELEGLRYGLHFLGALPGEDISMNSNQVRITPKKKLVKISIDREQVVKPKKSKKSAAEIVESGKADADQPVPAKIDDEPAGKTTTTTSPEHAADLLRKALDAIFSDGLDEQMIAAMPKFWQGYFAAAAVQKDAPAADPNMLSQTNVDRKAQLLTAIEAPSNEFAQNGGVAGMALYRAVVGADGSAGVAAVLRPIGFGLDENAVEAIEKAKFEPAMKGGKPVSVNVDVAVQFRIYSKRTGATAKPEAAEPGHERKLPGPYSLPPS